MKFSEQWLREWVNPPINTHELAEQLTMAGIEIDSITPVAGDFNQVVVGQVLDVTPHPKSEKLHVCQVNVGEKDPLNIVCGAANVRANLKVAVALVGAKLPDGRNIQETKLKEITSQGMLCSAQELNMQEGPDEKILELPEDAPVGEDLRKWLHLNEFSLDAHVTPNRGDCLSIAGIAREVAVLNNCAITMPKITDQAATIPEQFPITVNAPEDCPRYLGRVIRGIKPNVATPMWMHEKLRRSDIRSIHPVVDVTNYVMLELGQPMHAFDLAKLKGGIVVRLAHANEKIILLDNKEVTLDKETLVIADESRAQALAGIMGGLDAAVSDATTDIFLECAYFNPIKIAGRARSYGLNSDSSYRFERGIDPDIQQCAMERATQLILEIAGGKAGPVLEVTNKKYLPKSEIIILHNDRIERILGIQIPTTQIESILQQLGMQVVKKTNEWQVVPPSYRYDINIEEDLIEELARIYGYNNIPNKHPQSDLIFIPQVEGKTTLPRLRSLLIDRDYHEAITYSFIAPKQQKLITPDETLLTLINPISADLSVMRASLWPGLLNAAVYNQNRQQSRIRLFETGLRYVQRGAGLEGILQQAMLGGIVTGSIYPEQWGTANRPVDFFDVKNDMEAIINLTGKVADFTFQKGQHPALHPGQNCEIFLQKEPVGHVGALHPALLREFDLTGPVFLFELNLDAITPTVLPKFEGLSKFPAIRRDISFWIDNAISVQDIFAVIKQSAGDILVNLNLFDIYQSKEKNVGQRSLALGLILQLPDRTLIDAEVNTVMEKVLSALQKNFSVNLRDHTART